MHMCNIREESIEHLASSCYFWGVMDVVGCTMPLPTRFLNVSSIYSVRMGADSTVPEAGELD